MDPARTSTPDARPAKSSPHSLRLSLPVIQLDPLDSASVLVANGLGITFERKAAEVVLCWKNGQATYHQQWLELLGDACLSVIILHKLVTAEPDSTPASKLNRYRDEFVSKKHLSKVARALASWNWVVREGPETVPLDDLMEVLVGAALVGANYQSAESAVDRMILATADSVEIDDSPLEDRVQTFPAQLSDGVAVGDASRVFLKQIVGTDLGDQVFDRYLRRPSGFKARVDNVGSRFIKLVGLIDEWLLCGEHSGRFATQHQQRFNNVTFAINKLAQDSLLAAIVPTLNVLDRGSAKTSMVAAMVGELFMGGDLLRAAHVAWYFKQFTWIIPFEKQHGNPRARVTLSTKPPEIFATLFQ